MDNYETGEPVGKNVTRRNKHREIRESRATSQNFRVYLTLCMYKD